MSDPQAIVNPFEQQAPTTGGGGEQAISNPFEQAQQTAPAAPSMQQDAHNEMSARPGGISGWLHDMEGDLKYGSENTIVGRVLKKMGAQPLHNGTSEQAADMMLSPVLGTSRAVRGEIAMQHGAVTGNRDEVKQGGKDTLGGIVDAAQIPGAFIAPEAGEAGATAAGDAVEATGGYVSKVAQRLGLKAAPGTKALAQAGSNPATVSAAERTAAEINSAALPELHGGISKALDSVASSAKTEIDQTLKQIGGTLDANATAALDQATKTGTLSQKADAIGNAMRSSAQQIYQKLDEAGGGGRFQRYAETIKQLSDELRNPALVGEPKIQLQNSLKNAQTEFDAFKQEMVSKGLNDSVIKSADKMWSKGASLDEWSRKLLSAEELNGGLKAGAKPLNNAVRDLTAKASPRGHVLRNGMGSTADEVTGAVQKAADTIATERQASAVAKKTVRSGARAQKELDRVSRNRKVAVGSLGALGGAAVAGHKYGGALFGSDE